VVNKDKRQKIKDKRQKLRNGVTNRNEVEFGGAKSRKAGIKVKEKLDEPRNQQL